MKRARLWPIAALAMSAASAVVATDAAAGAPKLVKGPYLTGLSESGVEVRFELDAAAPASVELKGEAGSDASSARAVADASSSMHTVHVTGLEPGKAYEYAVRVGGALAGNGRFVTAPRGDAGGPVKFVLYGDTRSNETVHAAIMRAILATPSDFLVNTGDLVAAGGSASDWQDFFQIEQPLLRDRALFLCIGNHELSDDRAGSSFARYFGYADPANAAAAPQPYGTMRWGSARLFFLNGMHDWEHGAERDWLERELAKADSEAGLVWRIAVAHQGPWSSGPHGGSAKLDDALVPQLLAAHKVDLLLAGHDHIYERGDHGGDAPLKYVISGGGGAPLYPIEKRPPSTRKAESAYHFVEVTLTAEALRMVAHRLDGTVLESCGFAKGHPWDCDATPKVEAPHETAGQAPEGTPSSSPSRCGCVVPGAPVGIAAGAWLALAGMVAAGVLAARNRRG
jgi:3',5'-cyclic AMP phosphodiesterase CpdA